ncbi:MAG: type II toxin-antitoxin system CcdA family antitoxin [Haliea sp.]|nr:type II toxin-antitoxin system CcdA family antitoxin [Haliea sp.]
MQPLFDTSAPKMRIDIAINSDLLMKCRPLYISVSAMLEKSFNQHLAEHAASQQFR